MALPTVAIESGHIVVRDHRSRIVFKCAEVIGMFHDLAKNDCLVAWMTRYCAISVYLEGPSVIFISACKAAMAQCILDFPDIATAQSFCAELETARQILATLHKK